MSHLQKLFTCFCVAVILTLSLWVPIAWGESVKKQLISPSQVAFQKGITAFQNKDYQQATEAFTQAIQQQPDFVSAYSNLCLTHLVLKQYQQAITDCTQGLQLDLTHTEFYLNRGLAYYRLGKYQDAIADYDQLLQLQPQNYRAYYNRGLAQLELGKKVAALADYNQSLKYTPLSSTMQRADILNDRGIAYLQLQQPQEAIADFTQVISLNANDVRAYFNRACACHYKGDFLAAFDDFKQVLTLSPNHAQTYFNRGMMHYQMGNVGEAITDLQQAAQCFHEQGVTTAYQNTLYLLHEIQHLSSFSRFFVFILEHTLSNAVLQL